MLKHPFTREQIASLCAQDMCAYARALLILDGGDPHPGAGPSFVADFESPEFVAGAIINALQAGDGKAVWPDHYRIPAVTPDGYTEKLEQATRHILTTGTFPKLLYPAQDPFADIRNMAHVVKVSATELVTQGEHFAPRHATYEGAVTIEPGGRSVEEWKALNAWLAIVTKRDESAG